MGIPWAAALVAACVFAGAGQAVTLSQVAGVPVRCVPQVVIPGLEGYWSGEGIYLTRANCMALVRRERSDEEAWSWIIFAHEIGHARGLVHEACPTPTDFARSHVALLAKRAGASLEYRRWLRGYVRQSYPRLHLAGEITCKGVP